MAPESPALTGGFFTTAPPGKPGGDSTFNSGRGQLWLGVQGLYPGLQAPFISGSFTLSLQLLAHVMLFQASQPFPTPYLWPGMPSPPS